MDSDSKPSKNTIENARFKFCPRCNNLLVPDESDSYRYETRRFECPTCPYYVDIRGKISFQVSVERIKEEVEDIIDSEKAQQHRQRTQVVCPECSHIEAFFYQMQTRSADEPMTNFYECTNRACKHNWRD